MPNQNEIKTMLTNIDTLIKKYGIYMVIVAFVGYVIYNKR
jgi:hypothetical protein